MKARVIVILMSVKLMVFGVFPISWAITITEPPSGRVFHPGDEVVVKATTTPEETPQGVFFFVARDRPAASTIDMHPPFEFQFTIDPTVLGEIPIVASGKLPNGKIVEAEVTVNVVLPSTTVLTGIRVRDDQTKLYFNEVGRAKRASVYGQFSDGAERHVELASWGTTYTSSDEKVVTVGPDGWVRSVGPGMAWITIKNGEHKLTIAAEVKPKKK